MMKETIAANQRADGYIRLCVTRGVGALGINPINCERPTVFIIADAIAVSSARYRVQVDPRTDLVTVAPVPGTGNRYAPFALNPAPLPFDAATKAYADGAMGSRGAALLEDGTVLSCAEHPTLVGEGVQARHFVIAEGAGVSFDELFISMCEELWETPPYGKGCTDMAARGRATLDGTTLIAHTNDLSAKTEEDLVILKVQAGDEPEFIGQAEASRPVEIRSQVTGLLKAVLYPEGRDVKAGDRLYQIDPVPFQAAAASAKARAQNLLRYPRSNGFPPRRPGA